MRVAGLTAEVVGAVRGPLEEFGFEKRAGEVFTLELGDGVFGWLGLNRAYRRSEDALEVNPVVGVRHQEVERLVADLRAETFHPYLPPTASTPIGYLTPAGRYSPWVFQRGSTMSAEAEDLVDAVAQHGVPFMQVSTGLGELRRLIEAGLGFAHQLVYRHPVVCLLAGDREAALRSVERALQAFGDRDDPAAVKYRLFAARFATADEGRAALNRFRFLYGRAEGSAAKLVTEYEDEGRLHTVNGTLDQVAWLRERHDLVLDGFLLPGGELPFGLTRMFADLFHQSEEGRRFERACEALQDYWRHGLGLPHWNWQEGLPPGWAELAAHDRAHPRHAWRQELTVAR
jgi:hypothetical protein